MAVVNTFGTTLANRDGQSSVLYRSMVLIISVMSKVNCDDSVKFIIIYCYIKFVKSCKCDRYCRQRNT